MDLNPDICYEALRARDSRFDGEFFVAVSTTGIYCRPVCRVRLPGRDRCMFFSTAAAAEAAGYRPCLRCRPELAPGCSPMDTSARLCDLAVARIEAGALNNASLEDLAGEFAISSRQLRRIIKNEYGITPVQLAQTRCLLLAKQLLTDTSMSIHDVVRASGFASARRFHHLFQTRYRLKPRDLRRQAVAMHRCGLASESITLCLDFRPPLNWNHLIHFLAGRAAPSVEQLHGSLYVRTLRLGQCTGWIAAGPHPRRDTIQVEVSPSLLPVLPQLRCALRLLFDLDANPTPIAAHLSACPYLAPHLAAAPGLRVPGAVDLFELTVRAIVGQQISVRAATTIFARLVATFGEPIETPFDGLDRLPPRPESIANAAPRRLIDCGLTARRAATIQSAAAAMAGRSFLLGTGLTATPAPVLDQLGEISGIGPWTMQYIAMRAGRDPDAFPESDLALLKATGQARPARLRTAAEKWRPWRAYAAMYLWHSLSAGG